MARLTRWGNSDGGLRLPKAILEAAGLRVGDEIGCRLRDDGTIVLIPSRVREIAAERQSKSEMVQRPETMW